VVEDLNVKGIMANHCLAKATADAGWGMLMGFIEYKAARAGKAFIKCSRWYPSSKACSECGSICDKMPLDVRTWTCAHCDAHHDRDINAAKNIRAEGLRILAAGTAVAASGGNVSPKPRRNPRSKAVPVEAGSSVL
jgi:putative transposase